jgi:hypothetical protein
VKRNGPLSTSAVGGVAVVLKSPQAPSDQFWRWHSGPPAPPGQRPTGPGDLGPGRPTSEPCRWAVPDWPAQFCFVLPVVGGFKTTAIDRAQPGVSRDRRSTHRARRAPERDGRRTGAGAAALPATARTPPPTRVASRQRAPRLRSVAARRCARSGVAQSDHPDGRATAGHRRPESRRGSHGQDARRRRPAREGANDE